MFDFRLDGVERVVSKMDGMIKSLNELVATEIPEELTDWQTEDMRRKYPNTTKTDDGAFTRIWPTSRIAGQRPRRFRAAPSKTRMSGGAKGQKVRRPILRPALLESLVDRMGELLKSIHWKG